MTLMFRSRERAGETIERWVRKTAVDVEVGDDDGGEGGVVSMGVIVETWQKKEIDETIRCLFSAARASKLLMREEGFEKVPMRGIKTEVRERGGKSRRSTVKRLFPYESCRSQRE